MQTRRATEKRLKDYATASAALVNLERVGELADEQVNELRSRLRHDAAAWRERIYLGAYPGTALRFVDATMGRKGELDLLVEAGGVAAPAQHVSNASALRATLVAFYLAFWEFVYRERGGLSLLVFDDPQELLDDENRERLSAALKILVARGAQVVVTSYDPRFCSHVSRLDLPRGLARYVVHPATRQQPTIRVSQPLPDVLSYKAAFDADENDEVSAMRFTEACRVFFEARLGDMMDEPGYNAWAIANPDPTLATFVQRLRTLVKAGPSGMFSAHVFKRFVDHPALADGSPVLALMNKAHHGRRQEIRAADVARCANELSELLEIVEQMDEEAYRWRRRDEVKPLQIVSAPVALTPPPLPRLDIAICPDLAAFTGDATVGESQSALEVLDPKILDGVVAFYLRRPNFAFAAPQGSLALAEAVPGPVADRRLVIARHGKAVYARRLVRSLSSTLVGLTAEVPDPRTRSPRTVLLPEAEVELHQVIGIVFDHKISIGPGEEEAVVVDAGDSLKRVEIAFRVVEDSAVPLALRKQIVLGGAKLNLANLGQHEDSLVALALDDGSSLFKRIGPALPGPLAHLRKFESIGGLGSSQILAIEKPQEGIRTLVGARSIIGVLYNA